MRVQPLQPPLPPTSAPVPMFVPPVVQPTAVAGGTGGAIGPQRKKVTVPVGSAGLAMPVTVIVASSWTAVPGVTEVPVAEAVVVMAGVHDWKVPRMKSFSVAVTDCEERVSAAKLEKHSFCSPRKFRFNPPS